MIFEQLGQHEYEQLIFCHDKHSGLKAIIAIHDTTLGPALGGTRMWNYENEENAIIDALRLARGMTYKAAAAGLNLGGGKAVIIGDPQTDKSEALFRAFGRYIQGLNGRYITAEDVGTTEMDMDIIHQETEFVTGVSAGAASGGNPAPFTALGIYLGMKATAKEAFGSDSLAGKTIAIQGVGNVATSLCAHLHEEGANLIVTDLNPAKVNNVVEKYGAKAVDVKDIFGVACDIFSPCALGGIINDETIGQFKAKAIAGSANNQLQEDKHGDQLAERGIVYAPDYVINAGGLIQVGDELLGYNHDRAQQKVEAIYDQMSKVFAIANRDQIPSYKAADRMVEERIASVKRSTSTFLQNERHMLNRGQ